MVFGGNEGRLSFEGGFGGGGIATLVDPLMEFARVPKNEGDLVAKVYYAKKKLVWEFLDGPLKNKIEIQWSEISAIRAFTYEDEHGQLEIELNQQPQFRWETNPQPRKHTQWKQTSDFTGGQGSVCRRHVIVFPPGVLDRQYEKLLQCDSRLFSLSQQPFPVNNYPYFNYDPNHCLNFSSTYVNHRRIFDDHDPNSPMSVMRFPYSNERTRRHVNENEERVHSHFEGLSAITYGLQDHVLPCYGQESWIPISESQTNIIKKIADYTSKHTVFWYGVGTGSFLVTIKGLMIPWTLTLALVDAFSVFVKRPYRQVQLVSVIVIGDWILSFLSLAAACSTASVLDFMVTEAGSSFCDGEMCSRYQLSAAMACLSWCLTLASALFNLWLLPSLYSNTR